MSPPLAVFLFPSFCLLLSVFYLFPYLLLSVFLPSLCLLYVRLPFCSFAINGSFSLTHKLAGRPVDVGFRIPARGRARPVQDGGASGRKRSPNEDNATARGSAPVAAPTARGPRHLHDYATRGQGAEGRVPTGTAAVYDSTTTTRRPLVIVATALARVVQRNRAVSPFPCSLLSGSLPSPPAQALSRPPRTGGDPPFAPGWAIGGPKKREKA